MVKWKKQAAKIVLVVGLRTYEYLKPKYQKKGKGVQNNPPAFCAFNSLAKEVSVKEF